MRRGAGGGAFARSEWKPWSIKRCTFCGESHGSLARRWQWVMLTRRNGARVWAHVRCHELDMRRALDAARQQPLFPVVKIQGDSK